MIIETFQVGLLRCNCTIIGNETTREAIVVDPGDDAHAILDRLAAHNLKLKQIVCTHAHIDHVGAIFDLQENQQAPAWLHEGDSFLFESLSLQAEFLGVPAPRKGTIDRFVKDGDCIACSGIEVGALHTPGHTPGSMTFVLDSDQKVLFTGDTLFMNSIGRTDLWGGSYPDIISSIRDKLLTFSDDTLVIAGHGHSTTIGNERLNNPFLK